MADKNTEKIKNILQSISALAFVAAEKPPTIEVIRAAAIKTNSGIIIEGKNHAECYLAIRSSPRELSLKGQQGFITTIGRFIDRFEAEKIAYESGMIKNKPDGLGLVSEQIWVDNGYLYDQQRGYFLSTMAAGAITPAELAVDKPKEEGEFVSKIREQIAKGKSDWYCPKCCRKLNPQEVTFDEHHEECGTPVGGDVIVNNSDISKLCNLASTNEIISFIIEEVRTTYHPKFWMGLVIKLKEKFGSDFANVEKKE